MSITEEFHINYPCITRGNQRFCSIITDCHLFTSIAVVHFDLTVTLDVTDIQKWYAKMGLARHASRHNLT